MGPSIQMHTLLQQKKSTTISQPALDPKKVEYAKKQYDKFCASKKDGRLGFMTKDGLSALVEVRNGKIVAYGESKSEAKIVNGKLINGSLFEKTYADTDGNGTLETLKLENLDANDKITKSEVYKKTKDDAKSPYDLKLPEAQGKHLFSEFYSKLISTIK